MLRTFPALGSSLLATCCLALACAGCQEEASIATYDTPRTTPPATAVDPAEVRKGLDHMFAAVVPHGKQAWFFKLVAPAEVAEQLKQPFDDFVKSIELGEPGKQPTWKLAEGWTERAGGAEMRTATIEIPHDGSPLELTVSTLPFDGAWDPYLVQNVDRWLRQLQQGPLTAAEIEKIGRKLPVKGGEATAFELVGLMDKTGPMTGAMPAGHPPVGKASEAAQAKTQASGKGPAEGDAPVDGAADGASSEFTATIPDGWKLGPPRPMRKATYLIAGDGGAAEVSITSFPAVPMMADPLANGRRWAGEVGLSSMSDDQIKSAMTDMEIAGAKAQFFTLLPPPGEAGAQGTLAAMVPRGEQIWFFKLKGDRAAVEGQRDAIMEFLKSVKFAGEK